MLSLSVFSLAILAVAFDRHGDAFFLNTCAICKVKTTLSGTASANNILLAPAMEVAALAVTAVFTLRAAVVRESRALSLVSQIASVWPSRAPPFPPDSAIVSIP